MALISISTMLKGRFIVNGNLVKCAIAGCDPNVGRIVGSIGSFLSKLPAESATQDYTKDLVVKMGNIVIFEKGNIEISHVSHLINNTILCTICLIILYKYK